jgi:hypothetical protein
MLKLLRRALVLGLLAGFLYAMWKRLGTETGSEPGELRLPLPVRDRPVGVPPVGVPPVQDRPLQERPLQERPVQERPVMPAVPVVPVAAGWVAAEAGACPVSHPVKGKRSSGIFHVPGGQNYERTRADRCYVDAAAAEADGLRRALR